MNTYLKNMGLQDCLTSIGTFTNEARVLCWRVGLVVVPDVMVQVR